MIEKYRHPVTYFKSALGLKLLREEILGPERFDPAFRRFIAVWAYGHPKPDDFFRAMESSGGEDLSWWWRGWYDHNWTLDLAVDSIGPITVTDRQGETRTVPGTRIELSARDRLVLPATLRLAFADGSHRDIRIEADAWIRNPTVTVLVEPGKSVLSAEIDPEHRIPDRDRSNNKLVSDDIRN